MTKIQSSLLEHLKIKLENRAWRGCRIYIADEELDFNIELEYHYVRKQYMLVIYEYGYNEYNRKVLKKHHITFHDTIYLALQYAERYLNVQFDLTSIDIEGIVSYIKNEEGS